MDVDLFEKLFVQGDVLRAFPALRPDLLQTWINRGHVTVRGEAQAPGHPRRWTVLEIVKAGAVFQLSRRGVDLDFAKKGSQMVADHAVAVLTVPGQRNCGDFFLVVFPGDVGEPAYHMITLAADPIAKAQLNAARALTLGR